MNERIKELRKHLNMNQDSFGKRLGVTGPAVSRMESGDRQPSDQVILSICREFGVNEIWLRTGEGDMMRAMSREEELSVMMGKLLTCEPSFKHRLISVLLRMDEGEWEMLERKANELLEEIKKADP